MKRFFLSFVLALLAVPGFAQVVKQYDFAGRTLFKSDNGKWLEVQGSGVPSFTTFGADPVPQGVLYRDVSTGLTYSFSGSSWTSQVAAGVNCNVNSTTACSFTNTFGGASSTFSSSGAIIDRTTAGSFVADRNVVVATPKALTSGAAAAVFQVTGLGLHRAVGGSFEFCVRVSDGTNDQIACGRTFWAGVDTTAGAGGETCTNLIVGTVSAALTGAASSGTLTVAADATTGTDLCNYRLTATSSLTPTTMEVTYRVEGNMGNTGATIAVVPQ